MYALRTPSSVNLVKALRIISGMDPSAGYVFVTSGSTKKALGGESGEEGSMGGAAVATSTTAALPLLRTDEELLAQMESGGRTGL